MKITQILPTTLILLLGAVALHAANTALESKAVDTLVEPYLSIQKGLADDNLEAAQKGADAYLSALETAAPQSPELAEPAKTIAAADDIQAARTAFRSLSKQMIPLVEQSGAEGELYTAHCPMAFNNEGAAWIQKEKTVSNPYYGSMMLRCGRIQKQIAGTPQATDKKQSAPPKMSCCAH